MHNELFNQIDIHTYHPGALVRGKDSVDKDIKWNYLTRDLWPKDFLHQIWSGRFFDNVKINDFVMIGQTPPRTSMESFLFLELKVNRS